MSDINNITSSSNYSVVDQEQLFRELTLEEGAAFQGGAEYILGNQAGITVNYSINGTNDSLFPGDETTYDFTRPPTVRFDRKIGTGYQPRSVRLTEGYNGFDIDEEGYLILRGNTNSPYVGM